MAFPLSLYVSLTVFQVFRVVPAPVPDQTLDPNVQTCAQVMALQLHRKVQKMNLTQQKLAKMLYDCSLFWEGVHMSDMGSQVRGPCVFDSDLRQFHHLRPQSTWMMCVCSGKTGVTANRDKIEFRLFNSGSIFNITLREELFSLPKQSNS